MSDKARATMWKTVAFIILGLMVLDHLHLL